MTASGRLYRMLFLLVLGLILAVPSHGQTAEEYCKQAVELSRAKSRDEAIANYRKALEVEPNDATMHYDLALALKYKGDTKQAVEEFESALSLKPK
jgi:tetratricopeptide (TPR) repeat protein